MIKYTTFLFSIFLVGFSFGQSDIHLTLSKAIPALPESYFVIQANTISETYAQSSQIIERTAEIRKYQPCQTIVYLFTDGAGIGKNQILSYTRENFNVIPDSTVFIVVDDSIYRSLGTAPHSVVHYFYEGNLLHSWDGKYEHIPKSPLPYNMYKVGKGEFCSIEYDPNFIQSNQSSFYPINEQKVIQIHDSHSSRVRLLELPSGKIVKIFDEKKVNYPNRLISYLLRIGHDTNGILSGINYLNSIKRSSFKVATAHVISPSEIYLIGDVSFVQKARKKTYIPGEYDSTTIEINPDEMIQESVSFVLRTNSEFEILDLTFFDVLKKSKYTKNNFVDPITLFHKEDDGIFCLGYNYNENRDKTYEKFYNQNERTQFIHRFGVEDSLWKFQQKEKPLFDHPYRDFYFYQDAIYSAKVWDKLFFVSSIYPEVYELNSESPISSLCSISPEEYRFKKDNYDTSTVENIPFYIYSIRTLKSEKQLMLFYRLRDQYFVEIRGNNFELIQRINFTNSNLLSEEMKNSLYYNTLTFFTENYLYTYFCDSEKGCFFYRYEFELIDK